MRRSLGGLALGILGLLALAAAALAQPNPPISFTRQIQPILTARCQGCHQASIQSGGLQVTTFAALSKGGRHGPPFAAGKPDESLLVRHLAGALEPRMPMGTDPLPESDIELFRRWIAEGANEDSGSAAGADAIPTEPPVYSAPPVITALAYSPDGALLAVSGNHEVVLHRADGGGLAARLVGRAERIHALAFSSDGKRLLAVGGSPARFGEIQLWDVPARKLVGAAKVGTDTLFGAAFSPDGARFAFGSTDKTVRVWDAAQFQEIRKMESHEDWVFATEFSVDGRRLVSVSRDHFVKLYEIGTGMFLENLNLLTKATFGGHGELYALSRHPTKDIVVAGGDDRTPRMYTMHRPRAMKIDDDSCLLRELGPQPGAVQAVRFSPDGAYVAVAGRGETINVYDAATGARVSSMTGHKGAIYAVDFGPGGGLVAAGFDGTVRIYEVASGTLLRSFVPVPVVERPVSSGVGAR